MVILAIGLAVPAAAETPLQVAAEYTSPDDGYDSDTSQDIEVDNQHTGYFDTKSTLDDIGPTNTGGGGVLLANQSREGTAPTTNTPQLESTPEIFNVMVPTSLLIHIDSTGNITTANGEEIINNGQVMVEVTNIQVTTMNGWSLCEWGTSWEESGVGIKEFSMQLNENSVNTDGTCGLLGFGEIPANGSQILGYAARVAPQVDILNEEIAQVIFTISASTSPTPGSEDIPTPLSNKLMGGWEIVEEKQPEPGEVEPEQGEKQQDSGEVQQDSGEVQPEQGENLGVEPPDTDDSEQYIEETYEVGDPIQVIEPDQGQGQTGEIGQGQDEPAIPTPYSSNVLTTEPEESKVYIEPSNNGELKRQALKTPTREWIETECCHPGSQVIGEVDPIPAADSFNFNLETGRFTLVNPVEYNTNTILTRAYAMDSNGDLIEMVEVKTEEERVFIRCTQENCENYQREFEALETYDWLYYRPYTVN